MSSYVDHRDKIKPVSLKDMVIDTFGIDSLGDLMQKVGTDEEITIVNVWNGGYWEREHLSNDVLVTPCEIEIHITK
jgi:hypothetical protein